MKKSSSTSWNTGPHCSRGAVTPLMLIAVLVIVTSGFGIQQLLVRWHQLVRTQLRLDICVGTKALELKKMIQFIEARNREIKTIRMALAATFFSPEAKAALTLALQAEVFLQESRRIVWRFKQMHWILQRGCGDAKDFALPLPNPPWVRDPPDAIGPQALRWASEDHSLRIAAFHFPRQAQALVEKNKEWSAQWTSFKTAKDKPFWRFSYGSHSEH